MSDGLGSLGSVNAVFDANTELFDKKVKAAGETATVSARAIVNAQKRQADAVAFSSKFAADAIDEQSLRIVAAQRRVGEANADYVKSASIAKKGYLEEADSAKLVAASLQRLTRAREEAAVAAKIEGEATHAAVSQQMAASAAVRGLEGNAGVRSVERFLISIPGVGVALQNIFPLIGGAMFVGLLARAGVELYDLEQKGKHAGEEIDRAFGEMNDKVQVSNDKLALTNAKLEEQIAKFAGRPTNGLQIALGEARVAADELQESLASDIKSLEALLKDRSVGALEAILAGVAPTSDAFKEITDSGKLAEKKGAAAGAEYARAFREAGGDVSKQSAATKAYDDRMDQIGAEAARKMRQRATEEANRQKELDKRLSAPTKFDASGTHRIARAEDLTDVRSAFEDAAVYFDKFQQRTQLSGQNFADNAKDKAAQGAKELVGASRKADEQRLKQAEATLALQRLNGNDSINFQYQYWENMKSSFAKGSEQYNSIVEKQLALSERAAAKAHELIEKFKKDQASLALEGEKAAEAARSIGPAMRADQRKQTDTTNEQAMRDRMERRRVASSLDDERRGVRETGIREDAGRGISKLDAAAELAAEHQELAARHTQDFNDSLSNLTGRQQFLSSQLSDPEVKRSESERNRLEAQQVQLRADIARLQESRAHQQMQDTQQSMQDAQAMHPGDSLASVGFKDALDEFVVASRDAASAMREITSNTLEAINGGIMKDLTSRNRSDRQNVWTDVGKNVFTGVAGAGLKKGEGMLLDSLGFGSGKAPKGTAGDPLHVVMAGGIGSAGSMPGIIKNVVGGGGVATGNMFTRIFSSIGRLFHFPGFATGVTNFGGGPAWVGEHGPELAMLPPGSNVYPNGKVPKLGGDTYVENHYHMEGAAGVDHLVSQMRSEDAQWHRRAVTDTVGIIQDNKRRGPSMSTGRF